MTRREALAEYGSEIQENGSASGEPIILKYEGQFPGFRKLAYAVGVLLRTAELLEEEGEDPADYWKA